MLLFYHNDIGMLLIQTLCIKMNLYHGLTYQEFKNIIKEIPLKYFQIEIDEQSYLIKPHFNLIIEVLNDIIYINLNDLETSTSIFQELIKNPSFQGLYFEELVHYQIKPTLKTFKNFSVEQIVYVDNLFTFKKISPIHSCPKTFYIRPNNSFSPVFDAALLIRYRESYKIVFFQISINKEKLLTNEDLRHLFFFKRKKNIGNNTIKEYDSIRTNIYNNFLIDIKPENFYFYYIVIFSDIWYNSDRGDYCAHNNIKIKKFRVLLYHSVLYKCRRKKYFKNHPKARYVS